jgi:hypothetical protein
MVATDAGSPTPDDPGLDPKALAKQRFRAALDRKQAGGRSGGDGARNDGAVHGPEVATSGRRSFRRKTG